MARSRSRGIERSILCGANFDSFSTGMGNAISRSHSSSFHGSLLHQSPDVRHGPDAARTLPHTPPKKMRAGASSPISIFTGMAGRKTRNAVAGKSHVEVGGQTAKSIAAFGV